MSDDTNQVNVDRHGLEVLSVEECWALLAAAPIGRVALVDAGEPSVFPVTHAVEGHTIAFRSGSGTKLEAAAMNRPLAFEVDDWDAEQRSGWSVLAHGMGETVYEDEVLSSFESGLEPWLDSATRGTWIRIRVTDVSGRRIRA
ncbi:MAG: pyridoxamine 5'-phosphate oxidase family protein [Acidimicrobiales bacterium]|nr:pyridoxamine 5'-phosphate oxidase family protein [Acidimicrobiales bacterium]